MVSIGRKCTCTRPSPGGGSARSSRVSAAASCSASPTSGWRLRMSGTRRSSRECWRPDSRTTTPVTPCKDSRPPAKATDHTGLRTDDARTLAAAALFLGLRSALFGGAFLGGLLLRAALFRGLLGGSLHRARALSCGFGLLRRLGGLLRGGLGGGLLG